MRPSDMAAPFCSLTAAEVGEVQPLDGLAAGRRRAGDVVAVGRGHRLELAQRPDLLGELLALADDVLGRPAARRARPAPRCFAAISAVDAVERRRGGSRR